MNLDEAKNCALNYLMLTYNPHPVLFVKGEGSYLYDNEGKKYLDFFSGIAVNNLGHCQENVVEAIINQAKTLMHVSNLYYTEPMLKLAKALVEQSGFGTGKVFFCNSGTEANEAALKLARLYGFDRNKSKVVTALNSFHGRTLGGLSLTGQKKYHKKFYPLVPEITYTVFNDLQALENDLTGDTAALFLECVQGEGGVRPARNDYLQKAREICRQRDILLVFDEVQTGIGRTGEFFAYENYGVLPDVVTLAKGLGGGLPLGAVIATDQAAVFNPGQHASTFGGNPLTTSAALAVIETICQPEFLTAVKKKAALLQELLTKPHPLISEVRGLGLMLGIELKIPAAEVVKKALTLGLVIGTAGENVIRLLPPLNITEQEILTGVEVFSKSLSCFGEKR